MEKKYIVGSFAFFKDMPGYALHDLDYVIISDEMFNDYHHLYLIKDNVACDIFYWKVHEIEWYVKSLLRDNSFPLYAVTFLVPAIAKEVGMTIEHLKMLKPVIDRLDEVGPKYAYYKDIYNAYVENNGFFMTDEQLRRAYRTYKSAR